MCEEWSRIEQLGCGCSGAFLVGDVEVARVSVQGGLCRGDKGLCEGLERVLSGCHEGVYLRSP